LRKKWPRFEGHCNVNSVGSQRVSSEGSLGVLGQAKGEVRHNVDWLCGHRRTRYIYKRSSTQRGTRAWSYKEREQSMEQRRSGNKVFESGTE